MHTHTCKHTYTHTYEGGIRDGNVCVCVVNRNVATPYARLTYWLQESIQWLPINIPGNSFGEEQRVASPVGEDVSTVTGSDTTSFIMALGTDAPCVCMYVCL